jgi:hypothetical protein
MYSPAAGGNGAFNLNPWRQSQIEPLDAFRRSSRVSRASQSMAFADESEGRPVMNQPVDDAVAVISSGKICVRFSNAKFFRCQGNAPPLVTH